MSATLLGLSYECGACKLPAGPHVNALDRLPGQVDVRRVYRHSQQTDRSRHMTAWKHPYSRDSQSGAGNCVCGRQERHQIHPHEFMLSGTPGVNNCVCTQPYGARCHTMARGDLT